MSSGKRLGWTVVAGVLALTLGTAALAAAVIYRAGSIRVDVREKAADGSHIALRVPAVILHAALAVVPLQALEVHDSELRRAVPILTAALRAIERQPDAVFVAVETRQETARIAKRGGSLVVDVDAPDATVHVEIPLGSIGAVARRLDREVKPAGTGA